MSLPMTRIPPLLAALLLAAGCGQPSDTLSDEDAFAEQAPADLGNDPEATNLAPPPASGLPLPADAGAVLYKAVGNEPGWSLTVRAARMDYAGDYGSVTISEPTPPGFRGGQGTFRSGRLQVTIGPGPCSDGMSDLVYRQSVRIVADGRPASGCGGGTIAPATLAGTSWTVVSVNGRATPGGADYSLQFADGKIAAKFGCNGIGGSYRQNGDHVATADLAQTAMGCPEPAGTFESQGTAVLRSNMRVEATGGERLRLVSEAGTIDLKRAI